MPKAKLPEKYDIVTHDIRDGKLWVVEHTHPHGLRMQTSKGGVGRKYSLRKRQPHECVEFLKSQPAYATYDASKVILK
nr:MAG TPA: hypothetical protein [Bacteriophage sp.]